MPLGDRVLHAACGLAAVMPVLALVFLAAQMAISAYPAIVYSGANFLTGHIFSFGNLYGGAPSVHNGVSAPSGAQYGASTLIVGTLLTSLIAIGIGAPLAVAAVLLLVELPRSVQTLLSLLLELQAGIPSVVYGLWGIITFGPLLARYVYPPIAHGLGPWAPFFGGPTGYGQGLLTAGLVLTVMIVPIVATTTRELVRSVPTLTREGAMALGLTGYETTWTAVIPFIRGGILAAAMLGWARALGETMAVLMISGNALNVYPQNIYAPVSTIAGTIAAMLDSALTDATSMSVYALAEAGLALLLITLVTNLLARLIVRRVSSIALPIGRGI
ncbi:MAG: phosphate ABC transporter permease subunit PstC [Chloroflexota bacterium]